MYSGEYDVCDVTLSVYPHRASLKNMPGHGGNRTYDLWYTSPMLCQLSYAVRMVRVSRVVQLAEHWASIPKVVGSIPPWPGIFFKLARCGYTLSVTSQTSYSPEYTTPTQKKSYSRVRTERFKRVFVNRCLFNFI